MLLDERKISRALARVCNSDGATLGTAFFVLPNEGVALTCHHLLENTGTVFLDCADGAREGVIADSDRFPEIDLAVITCSNYSPPCAPPLVAEYEGITRFWTKGFHFHGTDITDALPASGEVVGTTSISFSTSYKTYRLNDVLLLTHDVIEPGLSGAPVFDPQNGIVFAIVNAKFQRAGPPAGFALPLARVREHSQRLSDLFEHNSKTVPRYGRFLNRLGAAEICQLQRAAMLDALTQRDLYRRELYVDRAQQEKFKAFYESDKQILPLIGNAGVGKTMLLAEHARRTDDKETVLLLGRDLRPDESDLSFAVTSRLREAAPELLGLKGDASLVSAALSANGESLTIMFDGLNEIPVSVTGSLTGWIDRTAAWLAKTKTKLIVSSRPEFWETHNEFPLRLIFSQETHRQTVATGPGVVLNDFSEDEASAARERYGLSSSISTKDIQHPLLARLYWETQIEGHQKAEHTTRYRVMQTFIKRKCERIARASGHGVLSSHVEAYLREAARRALERDEFELNDKEFFEIFGANSTVGDQSVHEGMFMTTSAGKRFTFDEIAEFLQSKSVSLENIASRFLPEIEKRPNLTPGAVVYSVLRLEDEGKDEQVVTAIETLMRNHTESGPDYLLTENAIVQLLPQIQRPERFITGIEKVVRTAAERGPFDFVDDRFGLRSALARSELPLIKRLDLLKVFLVRENSFEFEHHHWPELETNVISDRDHTGAIISDLIRSEPARVFEIMTQWLGDFTTLVEAKSAVADASGGLMFAHRHLAFEKLCEVLVRSVAQKRADEKYFPHKESLILADIASADPEDTLALCLRWSAQNDPILLEGATRLANQLAHQTPDEPSQHALYRIFERALASVDAETEAIAKVGIGNLHLYRDRVIRDLISLFKRNNPYFGGYELARLSDTHFDLIATAVTELVESDPKLASDALVALSAEELNDQEKNTLVEILKLGASSGLAKFFDFQMAVERFIAKTETRWILKDPWRWQNMWPASTSQAC